MTTPIRGYIFLFLINKKLHPHKNEGIFKIKSINCQLSKKKGCLE